MTNTPDPWLEIIRSSLTELGAKTKMKRGAALQQLVSRKAATAGLDLADYLRREGLKFSDLLDRFSDSVNVVRIQGTDMFVGIKGATLPDDIHHGGTKKIERGDQIRPDVYDAFTRIKGKYGYHKSTDTFVDFKQLKFGEELIDTPQVSLADLTANRCSYAEQITDSSLKNELLESLQKSDNMLGAFQLAVTKLGLRRDWHTYNYNILSKMIRDWSMQSGIEFNEDWISNRPPSRVRSPHQILSLLARHMSDDDVRGLNIPIRVVEQLLRSQDRNKTP